MSYVSTDVSMFQIFAVFAKFIFLKYMLIFQFFLTLQHFQVTRVQTMRSRKVDISGGGEEGGRGRQEESFLQMSEVSRQVGYERVTPGLHIL